MRAIFVINSRTIIKSFHNISRCVAVGISVFIRNIARVLADNTDPSTIKPALSMAGKSKPDPFGQRNHGPSWPKGLRKWSPVTG